MERKMDKKVYKTIKRYNREEMERFFTSIFRQGYNDGAKTIDNGSQIDFEMDLVEKMKQKKGIGNRTIEMVLEALRGNFE